MPRPRWALTLMLAGAMTACSTGPSGPSGPLGHDPVLRPGEIRIPPASSGRCSFDYRTAVSLLSLDGEQVWTTDIPWKPDYSPSGDEPGPVIADGAAVEQTSRGLVAVDVGSGDPLWHWDADLKVDLLDAHEDAVLAFSRGGLAKVAARTGEAAWTWDSSTEHPDGTAVASGPDAHVPVLAVSGGFEVTGFDRDSGDTAWRTETGTEAAALTTSWDGQAVYLVAPLAVEAYASATGEPTWQWRSTDEALVTYPVQDNGRVVVVRTQPWSGYEGTQEPNPDADQLVVLDATDGHELWRVPFPTSTGGDSVVTGSSVLVWQPDGVLLALDPLSGDPQWEASAVADGSNGARFAVNGDVLVVTPQAWTDQVAALDLTTGRRLWSVVLEGSTFAAPGFVDGLALVGTTVDGDSPTAEGLDNGRLYALDVETGDVVWSASFRDGVREPPVITDDGLLVTSSDGSLFCD